MPFEVSLGDPPAGYVLRATKPGEDAPVQCQEFTSTEDGQHFVSRLEGFPSEILSKVPGNIQPPDVRHLLAVIRRDGTATVFINELDVSAVARASGPIEAGQVVTKDDLVDVISLDLGVEIPQDCGVAFLFSVGWRKGFYYDFTPIGGPEPTARSFDLGGVFGRAYCHVLFQERFAISDIEWQELFAQKWFPFAGLKNSSIDKLIASVRSGWGVGHYLDEFEAETRERVDSMYSCWKKHPSFSPHAAILERAVDAFKIGDYLCCTGLLYPRIEGVLRTHNVRMGDTDQAGSKKLVDSAVASELENPFGLLMPRHFERYLREVFFEGFSPAGVVPNISRNSVAHGVADPKAFDKKHALLAVLITHQLFYFLKGDSE